ncbi:hypothetical protein AVDCRST_MAG84-2495, partial [uncultured Microcoleus sp.]
FFDSKQNPAQSLSGQSEALVATYFPLIAIQLTRILGKVDNRQGSDRVDEVSEGNRFKGCHNTAPPRKLLVTNLVILLFDSTCNLFCWLVIF